MSETERRETYINRRDLIKYIAIGAGGIVVAGLAGNLYGSNQERQKHLSPGEIPPELRAKLEAAGYFIYKPEEGETIANMRAAGLEIPPFPLSIPEGQPDPEKVSSKRKWIAFKPGEFYLPSEEGTTPRILDTLVSKQSTAVQKIDSGLRAVPGEVVEYIGLDLDYRLTRRESIFNQVGFVITNTKIGNYRVAIGRAAVDGPLGYSIFDTSTQNPTLPPDRLQAAGIIVTK